MIETQCINVDELDFPKQFTKGKRIKLIVKDEEVYILNMILPKISRFTFYEVIRGELSLRFKNTDNIMFDYSIVSKEKNKIQVKVFCFHWEDEKTTNIIIDSGLILKSIIPVQFHVLEKYLRKIKQKNYYFVFIYFERLYLIEVINNIVEMNRILKEYCLEEKFTESEKVKFVYHLNVEGSILNNCFENGFERINLGDII